MDSRIVYAHSKRLWEFRTCGHEGCEEMAVGQCESWNGGTFSEGNLCAKPLCKSHTFHLAETLPVCRDHIKKLAPVVAPVEAVQESLF